MAGVGRPIPEDPAFQGMPAGVARAGRHDLLTRVWQPELATMASWDVPAFLVVSDVREVLEPPLGVTRDLLIRKEASGQFTELFAEMLTVAVIARRAYDDDALTESDIEAYLNHSSAIFNSFRHP
jgi:hypothetical protein